MTLSTEDRNAIVKNRIEKSDLALYEAKRTIEMELWSAAANRLYYAVYNIVGALLIKNGYTTQTHAGIIRLLGLHFVKTGLIPQKIGRIYTQLFELRQSGDYDDWRIIEREDVEVLLEPAEKFIEMIKKLLDN